MKIKANIIFRIFRVTLAGLILVPGNTACKHNGDAHSEFEIQSVEGKKFLAVLKNSNWKIEDLQGNLIDSELVQVEMEWKGNLCKTSITNTGDIPVQPKDIILFDISNHGLSPDLPIYGDGFQMLYQNGGTLGNRQDIGNNPDTKHYNLPELHDIPTAHGVLNIGLSDSDNLLLGFTSCKRFSGRISFDAQQILIFIDAEGIVLQPGESWQLEDFIVLGGENRGDLFNCLADEINKNHPPRFVRPVATGWCPWYCYRLEVTDQIIRDNLDLFRKKLPEFKYIQLDDGYQPFFGDWFDPNPEYGDVRRTIDDIRQKGFAPAIWVAPFIAQKGSRVLREHPDWFIKNEQGDPLDSSSVSFGGWRYGPWYALDGAHPEVQAHFENIFRRMREEWV